MLLFSTILDIDDKMGKDDFIRLVIEWNQGSPHEDNIIQNLVWNGERNIRFSNDDRLWMQIEEYRNKNIIAVRYEKHDADGVIWDTDYIMNFETMKMAIRLDRSFLAEAENIYFKFSTPHFITLLIEKGYLKSDNGLPILRDPTVIDEDNLTLVIDVVNGKRYRLPVVYVSRTYYDENPVNVGYMASKLKGVAHVFVEKSNCLNMRLKEACHGNNEYYGAIGIYYPNKALDHRRYLYRTYTGGSNVLMEKVIAAVMRYANNQRIDPLYTWPGVISALLWDRLVSNRQEKTEAETKKRLVLDELGLLKANLEKDQNAFQKRAVEEAQAEIDKVYDAFDEEIKEYQAEIVKLNNEIYRLQTENMGMKTKLDEIAATPCLIMGDEDEFYQGEIKDMILTVLSDGLKGIESKTRRYDIVKDIIKANNYQSLSGMKADTVKRLLNNYSGMTPNVKEGLEDLGFQVKSDGRHYKASYYGDERYVVVYGSTPSDVRAGKNNAHTTIKKAF